MKALIACEYSGIVRDAFLNRGYFAMSCDFLPTETLGPHYQGDVRDILHLGWDAMICHPDCAYLCGSGLHWNKRGATVNGRPRAELTEEALDFVRMLLNAPIPFIALENPVGCISTRIQPASQYIQPHQFGHDASKKTGLWLKNLPLLQGTKDIPGRDVEWPPGSGKWVKRWANQTDSGQNRLAPSEDRWKDRSRTYEGWAEAMAEQWGPVIAAGNRDLLGEAA